MSISSSENRFREPETDLCDEIKSTCAPNDGLRSYKRVDFDSKAFSLDTLGLLKMRREKEREPLHLLLKKQFSKSFPNFFFPARTKLTDSLGGKTERKRRKRKLLTHRPSGANILWVFG